jgi:hypothetical protein
MRVERRRPRSAPQSRQSGNARRVFQSGMPEPAHLCRAARPRAANAQRRGPCRLLLRCRHQRCGQYGSAWSSASSGLDRQKAHVASQGAERCRQHLCSAVTRHTTPPAGEPEQDQLTSRCEHSKHLRDRAMAMAAGEKSTAVTACALVARFRTRDAYWTLSYTRVIAIFSIRTMMLDVLIVTVSRLPSALTV